MRSTLDCAQPCCRFASLRSPFGQASPGYLRFAPVRLWQPAAGAQVLQAPRQMTANRVLLPAAGCVSHSGSRAARNPRCCAQEVLMEPGLQVVYFVLSKPCVRMKKAHDLYPFTRKARNVPGGWKYAAPHGTRPTDNDSPVVYFVLPKRGYSGTKERHYPFPAPGSTPPPTETDSRVVQFVSPKPSPGRIFTAQLLKQWQESCVSASPTPWRTPPLIRP